MLKAKKIAFAIICTILLAIGTLCCVIPASARGSHGVSYDYTATWSEVTLYAMGYNGLASVSRATNRNSDKTVYFTEVSVECRNGDVVYEDDCDTGNTAYGKSKVADVAQDTDNYRSYKHDNLVRGGSSSSAQIMKKQNETRSG